jgi:hypothetical protein
MFGTNNNYSIKVMGYILRHYLTMLLVIVCFGGNGNSIKITGVTISDYHIILFAIVIIVTVLR